MFGSNAGISGISAWQGQHSNNNMNPEVLAQTLVNVAQNLLSSQQPQNDNYNRGHSHGESGQGRPSPWATANDLPKFRHAQEGTETTIRTKPLMGMGLLGAPPDGDYRAVRDRDPAFVIQDQNDSGGGIQGGFGIGEDMFRKKISSKGQVTDKSRKNYRPRIKEEGLPPKYLVEEFDHLHSKHFCCDLCDKKMWNSLSFVNHIKGNAHNKVVEDLIAEEASKAEEVRKLIAEIIKKDNGKPLPGRQGICHMCGLRVKGDMLKHRKEDYHQKLKTFIHPHCKVCDADFEDRSEWHYHKFSPEHLGNIEGSRYGLSYDPMSSKELTNVAKELENRIGKGCTEELKKNKLFKELKAANSEQPSRDAETQRKNLSKKGHKKVVEDSKTFDDDVIIVEDDNVSEKDLEPIMQEAEILGAEFIKPVNGLFCKLCKKFFGSGDESLRQHCKSEHHLQRYRDQTGGGGSTHGTKRSKAAEFFSPKKKK